jgi:hypothetical protein
MGEARNRVNRSELRRQRTRFLAGDAPTSARFTTAAWLGLAPSTARGSNEEVERDCDVGHGM